jgi:hypothetical protein
MQPLYELIRNSSQVTRKHVVSDSFIFQRTEDIKGTPNMLYIADNLDFNEIKKFILKNPEAVALNARKDLAFLLDAIDEVKDDLWLHAYDCIQITRLGLEILRINIAHSIPRGRCATIEMKAVRFRLRQAEDCSVWKTSLASTGGAAAAAFLVVCLMRFIAP